MNARANRPTLERKAYTLIEAAQVLSVGLTSFKRYVLPDLRVIRRGSITLVSARELDRWLDANEDHTL